MFLFSCPSISPKETSTTAEAASIEMQKRILEFVSLFKDLYKKREKITPVSNPSVGTHLSQNQFMKLKHFSVSRIFSYK